MEHPVIRLMGRSAVVLAIGATLLYPARNDVFEWLELKSTLRVEPQALAGDGSRLELMKNLGEVELWGEFILGGTPDVNSLRAEIPGGDELTITPKGPSPAGVPVLVSRAQPASSVATRLAADGNTPNAKYFKWPSGDPLVFAQSGPRIELVDWRIWTRTADSGQDTRLKANTRKWLDRLFALVWVVSFVWLVIKGKQDLEEKAAAAPRLAPNGPSNRALHPLILGLKAGEPELTSRVQAFLSDVLLEGVGPRESLKSLGLNPQEARTVRMEAVRLLDARLVQLQTDVTGWRTILDRCKA